MADCDPVDELKNLKHTTTVSVYQKEFENLQSIMQVKSKHYTDDFFPSSFISGLKFQIKCMVKLLKPSYDG